MESGSGAVCLKGILGHSGSQEVLLGFASASLLHSISFSDALDEESKKGYQRRFNKKHSLDFRHYICQPGSTTIPLTFNLRPPRKYWTIKRHKNGAATLKLNSLDKKVLAQVDGQHRLGYMSDLDVKLAFMIFISLPVKDEIRIFNTINGKAKGLSSSLLDYHDAQLANDLAVERPELFIALRLNSDEDSPWFKQLDMGGNQTSGMTRRASLRTMQKGIRRFLNESSILKKHNVRVAYQNLLDYWKAITLLLEEQWRNSRKYFITKGVGVYALNSIAADIYIEADSAGLECNQKYIVSKLAKFIGDFDWSHNGPLTGLGGESGVNEAILLIRKQRHKSNNNLRLIINVK
ncbi:MAG: DGQHR domain-containing protein [Proteobacteria bacterium]|nr:DGQHR domain-containing protein [Pseudomonadota bacterium]